MQVLSSNYDNYIPLAVALWKLLIVFCDNCTLGMNEEVKEEERKAERINILCSSI
jgi:hypothetical protein